MKKNICFKFGVEYLWLKTHQKMYSNPESLVFIASSCIGGLERPIVTAVKEKLRHLSCGVLSLHVSNVFEVFISQLQLLELR